MSNLEGEIQNKNWKLCEKLLDPRKLVNFEKTNKAFAKNKKQQIKIFSKFRNKLKKKYGENF